ncbi:protein phosphatase 2C domain-containing protein [Anabaena sp. FACHB-1237]|uniref:protein phosphatase 2C domain-containing protein n=1 Tax=Anabaena sp. FACHB-1237 TaxID=2692769 RepID=UPI001681C040|nr:protein phosphatase 2C domain-containing protein [Anabaena sp. FACHB-1237]MBD2138194.1 protein phosphatase 2C domain-containing protein [Anabaena sp. FACHB-1237]
MNLLTENTNDHLGIEPLIIAENNIINIANFQVKIGQYLGQLTTDIYYFQVNILSEDSNTNKLGLLRVGTLTSGLKREIEIREAIADYKLISPLLTHTQIDCVIIHLPSSNNQEYPDNAPITEEITTEQTANEATTNELENESEYLAEEYYQQEEINPNISPEKLILLSYLPESNETLETWLTQETSLEESIFIVTQICQVSRYLHQHNWCIINILPQFIQMTTPIQIYDLTNVYPVNETLNTGLLGKYCAPELASQKNPINELMNSYTVTALLYHKIHQKPINIEQLIDIKINPIPRIYQILKINLSLIPEERFSLSQLLANLVETRQSLTAPKITWQIANNSTLGLSTKRLQNEDNYGVKQQQLSNTETMILGVVADGMGGMSQGELASKIAVQTVLSEPIPSNFKTLEQRQAWLKLLFEKANENVNHHVKDGGTTLSVILAIGKQLIIAHVGDSRIYLISKGEIRQISEDHSLVALLVASGEITLEESLTHPDRNVLTKSIGSKNRLSAGYIQDLSTTNQELSINLEHQDILLLCSDGIWDLVPNHELLELFNQTENLQSSINQTINNVLERGASDNATILALQCQMEK